MAAAAPPPALAIEGRWEGVAAVRGAPMPVVLDVVLQGGIPRAWVTLPGRGHKGLALPAELRAGGVLRLDATPAFAQMGPPNPVPEMVLAPEAGGTQLRGHFAQAGHQAPLQLVRTGAAQPERETSNDPVPDDLAGTWHGGYTIGSLPRQVTLVFTAAKGGGVAGAPDRGSARAVIVGRRTVEVPFDGIEIGRQAITLSNSAMQLTFELRRPPAAGANGAELTGVFSQGPFEAALQLRREGAR